MPQGKWLRRSSLERRLFGWFLVLAFVPALAVLLIGTWILAGSLEWAGTLGPWDQVAESGRVVFETAEAQAVDDTAFVAALERHREELSASLVLARRWAFLGERLAGILPAVFVVLAGALALAALIAARRLARQLARPIGELVEWTGRLAREQPLPAPRDGEQREVREVRILREALRQAGGELADSRRRALEAERVRAWGEMARRVAHEMKNPLTPLRLAAHRLEARDETSLAEPAAVIREETSRLEELAARFAALGRPPEGPTSVVDLTELLNGLLASDVPAPIETALVSDIDSPEVEGHYEALVRAFRNLVRNAVEAVKEADAEGGRIEVTIIGVDASVRSGWVEVTVGDSGPGLPDDPDGRIFEPDFTTKSHGTGLGLALAKQAVTAHGGEIEARPGKRGGAEFVIRLPGARVVSAAAGL